MQDGIGQVGAGDSDMRIAGKDLQHNRQTRTADQGTQPARIVRQAMNQGGPMKEALDDEMNRHKEAKSMRMKHLEDHYTR